MVLDVPVGTFSRYFQPPLHCSPRYDQPHCHFLLLELQSLGDSSDKKCNRQVTWSGSKLAEGKGIAFAGLEERGKKLIQVVLGG